MEKLRQGSVIMHGGYPRVVGVNWPPPPERAQKKPNIPAPSLKLPNEQSGFSHDLRGGYYPTVPRSSK